MICFTKVPDFAWIDLKKSSVAAFFWLNLVHFGQNLIVLEKIQFSWRSFRTSQMIYFEELKFGQFRPRDRFSNHVMVWCRLRPSVLLCLVNELSLKIQNPLFKTTLILPSRKITLPSTTNYVFDKTILRHVKPQKNISKVDILKEKVTIFLEKKDILLSQKWKLSCILDVDLRVLDFWKGVKIECIFEMISSLNTINF